MKSITLQNFEIPDPSSPDIDKNRYRVFLFWNRRTSFTDRKKMLKFLSGASRELTYSATELIQLSKELYDLASDAFIAIDSWTGTEIESFTKIYENLNIAFRSHGPNSHVYIFKGIYDCIITLERISKRLIALYKKRNQFLQVRQLEIMLNRIQEVKNRVDRIGV